MTAILMAIGPEGNLVPYPASTTDHSSPFTPKISKLAKEHLNSVTSALVPGAKFWTIANGRSVAFTNQLPDGDWQISITNEYAFKVLPISGSPVLQPEYRADPTIIARQALRATMRGMLKTALDSRSSIMTRILSAAGATTLVIPTGLNELRGISSMFDNAPTTDLANFLGVKLGQPPAPSAPGDQGLMVMLLSEDESVVAGSPANLGLDNPIYDADSAEPIKIDGFDELLSKVGQISGDLSAVAEDLARIADTLESIATSDVLEKTSEKSGWVQLMSLFAGTLASALGSAAGGAVGAALAGSVSSAISSALQAAADLGGDLAKEAIHELFEEFVDILQGGLDGPIEEHDRQFDYFSNDKATQLFSYGGVSLAQFLSSIDSSCKKIADSGSLDEFGYKFLVAPVEGAEIQAVPQNVADMINNISYIYPLVQEV